MNVLNVYKFPKRKAHTFEDVETYSGKIDHTILNFFSPTLIIFSLFVGAVLTWGHKAIYHFFTAGEVPLNTMICAGIFFSLGRIVANLLILRRNAKYLRRIEIITASDAVNPDDVKDLIKDLPKSGSLMNTKTMAKVLSNMLTFGSLQFTDNDCRLIKSKIGQRCSHYRQMVGFLGGLLIMMGLLGTYLGLLETIDQVGKAMAGMANIGGSSSGAAPGGGSGGLNDDQMSGFIGSIAAPLQGMGLAFSASLFGIGGSLIVSFFNYLAGHIQNHFIENVSRWFDERIPAPTQEGKTMAANKSIPGSDDLKAWLSSFVYLSQKTHKKMGQMIVMMSQSISTMADTKNVNSQIGQKQNDIHAELQNLNVHFEDVKNQNGINAKKLQEYLGNLDSSMGKVASHETEIRNINRELVDSVNSLHQRVHKVGGDIVVSSQTVSDSLHNIHTSINLQRNDTQEIISAVSSGQNIAASLAKVEGNLAQCAEAIKANVARDNNPELANLVSQVNTLIESIDAQNIDQFDKLFSTESLESQARED